MIKETTTTTSNIVEVQAPVVEGNGTKARTAQTRLLSLDEFRGITIAGMVLVNNPGSWSSIYWPLEHAEWNGWTPTDLVFPFFLFIVGVAITLALGRRAETASGRAVYWKILRRSLLIFGLGFFLNLFPHFNLATVRIPGVLQRIAVCYLLASLIFLKTKVRTQVIIVAALTIGYCLLMNYVPAPGYAAGDLTKDGSLASYVDRAVFGSHVWSQAKVYDPEGLLSTLPALATTLIGVLTGHWLRSNKSEYEKVAGLFFAGMCLVVIGWAWNPFFPINKALWTSSYVFFTAGMALHLLAFCYWLVDIKGWKRWAKPFVVFGVNALALFVGTGLMVDLMGLVDLPDGKGGQTSLHGWIYQHLFLSWASGVNASLAYAIAFILLWLGIMWILYARRIYIKV
jgi:predicted acyltransferase